MRSKILGTGSYVPEEVLTNKQSENIVDTTDEWILERTGISERRIAPKGVGVSELSLPAAENAIKAAGLHASDIDLVIFSTITPDSMCPSAACWLQSNLNIGNCPAFDLNAACSGFVYGLQCSDAYLRSGLAKNVLLVGADIMTRVADWTDRGNCILWGDGAGAVVVGQSDDESGIIDTITYSNGSEGELILIVGGGSKLTPISEEDVKSNAHLLKMNGQGVFKTAVKNFSDVSLEILEKNGMSLGDLDLFIPHQANIRIIEAIAKRLNLPMEQVFVTIKKYANMSAATIPVALDEQIKNERIKKSDNILLAAFGGGLTWGASLLKW